MNRIRLTMGLLISLLMTGAALGPSAHAADKEQTKFKRVSPQYIAALGEPGAASGTGAQTWGLWPLDPGPRGVRLGNYDRLRSAGDIAPAGWKFDSEGWWLEEHGLIMERPEFPVPPGKYLVTGDRDVTSVLTIHPKDADGTQRWELSYGAKIADVTHLACRSARYTPMPGKTSCSPTNVRKTDFPVTPGSAMPPVEGCNKQDFAVLIVVGVGADN